MSRVAVLILAAVFILVGVVTYALWPSSKNAASPALAHRATCWTPGYAAKHDPSGTTPAPRHGKGVHGIDVCDKGSNG